MAQERMRRSERERQSRHRYESSHEERTTEAETRNAIVEGAALLNFRSKPDRSEPTNILGTLTRGTKVVIRYTIDDYVADKLMACVELEDGREGYVAYEFLKEV